MKKEYENESCLSLTASMGLKGGCVTGVVNRASRGKITKDALKLGGDNVISVAIASLEHLIN